MSQQINLLTPILLAPKRLFSALAMLQALGLLVIGGLLIAVWLGLQARQARVSFAAGQQQVATERQALVEALTRLPAPTDGKALEQQVQFLLAQNENQQQILQALRGGLGREGERHSDLLRLLAASVPPPVWLSEARWQSTQDSGRLELVGATLDTAALRVWLARLAEHRLLQGQHLSAVKIDSIVSGAAATGTAALPALAPNLPAWSFRVVSEQLPPAQAASAAASGTAGARP